MKKLIPQRIKNYYHLAQAVLANVWFGFPASPAGGPSRYLTVIGVTGTNGKTTTVQMITKILEEAGFKVAMASTINFKLGEKTWVNATKFTTLSSWQVQSFAKKAVKFGCKYLVLEVSSHSLDQNRIWGIKFDTAVITNITREHFDYHKNMENYRRAKLKLFQNARAAVVNLDMEFPEEYIDCRARNRYLYSCHSERSEESNNLIRSLGKLGMTSIVIAENIEFGVNYTKYQIPASPAGGLDTKYSLHLPGKFNLENALAATCTGLSQGINLETIKNALEKIKLIPGRMEYVPNNKGLNIIVDYAVTPDSLEKLYELILKFKEVGLPAGSPTSNTSIIAIFGACGERDRGKRPIMGEIVAKFADYVIVTNEDPYNEEPRQIINEVASGILLCHSERPPAGEAGSEESVEIPRQAQDDIFRFTENVNLWRVMDRREAIKKSLQIARPGDYIIITGKGAEETMAIGNERIEWNDKKTILEELENYK